MHHGAPRELLLDRAWLGFGCGAHSTRGGYRWCNVSETARYVEVLADGGSPALARQPRGDDEQLGDVLFTGLRLVEGLDLDALRRRYGIDVMARFGAELEPFVEAGLVVHGGGRLRLTRAGMLLANEVMKTFV